MGRVVLQSSVPDTVVKYVAGRVNKLVGDTVTLEFGRFCVSVVHGQDRSLSVCANVMRPRETCSVPVIDANNHHAHNLTYEAKQTSHR